MTEPKVVHSTFVVERSFSKPPETVFAALSKPEKVSKWFAEGDGSEVLEFNLDFTVGGTQHLVYRMKEGTPVPGLVIDTEARFQEIVSNDRIVMAATMKFDGKRVLASQITFDLVPSGKGTDLICTHQGAYFEGAPPQMPKILEGGWNGQMNQLGKVLEGA